MVYMTHRADVHVRLVPHEMLLSHRPFLLSTCRPAGAAHELSPERGQCDQRPEPGGARHREAPSPMVLSEGEGQPRAPPAMRRTGGSARSGLTVARNQTHQNMPPA